MGGGTIFRRSDAVGKYSVGARIYLVDSPRQRTYFAASLGLTACFRRPSEFLLAKADLFDGLAAFVPEALAILPSLGGAPFTTVVDMVADRCRP